MWYNLIIILIIFIAVFAGFTGYTLAKDNGGSAWDQLNKMELNNKLEQLPQSLDSWEKPVGAMCYKVAAPPERAEYICPECGEVTLYSIYSSERIDKIPYYRTLVKKIKTIKVTLDESQFCQKNNSGASYPELCLIVQIDKDSEPHKTCEITEEDITLLYDYSEGKMPLKKSKARLEELLGKKIEINKNNGK